MGRTVPMRLLATLVCALAFVFAVSGTAFAQDTGGIVNGRVGDNNAIYPDGSITAQIPSSIRLNKLTSTNMSVPYIRPGVPISAGVYLRSASTNSGDYVNYPPPKGGGLATVPIVQTISVRKSPMLLTS